jgi:LDH2 family malate/lactate/ureidoglycolate dehydrogenase
VRQGGTNPHAAPRVVDEGTSYVLVDGDNGHGQVTGTFAMRACLVKARETGIAMAGVKNSNHYGMGAAYAMLALEAGLVGICTTNGGVLIAPWGGIRPTFGNDPLSVAVPSGARRPIVLDIAMSVVAGGKVGLTVAEGKPLPAGWVLDKEGRPTTDPAAVADGQLVPIGEYKGYGLVAIMEILAGVLTGAKFGLQQDRSLSRDATKPGERGHFFLALDPAAFMPLEAFKARIDQLIDDIHGSPLAAGAARIFLPGEIEWESYERAVAENAVRLPGSTYAAIEQYANRNGLPLEA